MSLHHHATRPASPAKATRQLFLISKHTRRQADDRSAEVLSRQVCRGKAVTKNSFKRRQLIALGLESIILLSQSSRLRTVLEIWIVITLSRNPEIPKREKPCQLKSHLPLQRSLGSAKPWKESLPKLNHTVHSPSALSLLYSGSEIIKKMSTTVS